VFDLTNFIPQVAMAKVALAVALVVALFSGGLYLGYQWGSKALPEAEKAQQIDFTKTLSQRWQISSDMTVVYVDRIQKAQAEAQYILLQVPSYVKDTCPLSPGLRMLHDAATQGHLPAPEQVNDAGATAP
jgi:hypothetical protein